MRTLVIGIPLPHVSYDNYSFASAPSFADYPRLIVEPEAVSRLVDGIIGGAGEHRTFAGQPVVNAATSASAFGLADLLKMRRRDTEWMLANEGAIVCFAYPDVAHADVAGMTGWTRYGWLPCPDGFRYEEHLPPAFGKPGAARSDEGHPFAPYAEAFAPRLAYRAAIDESAPRFTEYGRVFIRSHGGVAIGADLAVETGRVILLPPLVNFETERAALAETLFECLERLRSASQAPERMRKEVT